MSELLQIRCPKCLNDELFLKLKKESDETTLTKLKLGFCHKIFVKRNGTISLIRVGKFFALGLEGYADIPELCWQIDILEILCKCGHKFKPSLLSLFEYK